MRISCSIFAAYLLLMVSNIGLYERINKTDIKDRTDIPIDMFIDQIRNGRWQDQVIKLRVDLANLQKTLSGKELTEAKQKAKRDALPYATISGLFTARNNAGLSQHSGYLAIDIDGADPEETKRLLKAERHVYAMFTSCSGNGLCVIFRINPDKHLASFEGIAEYLYNHYKIIIDQACKDLSRPRYVSFDPSAVTNDHAPEFKHFARVKTGHKTPPKERAVVFVPSEFENMIAEIDERGIDLVSSYSQWLKIAYAFAEKFGERGRDYFHVVSRQGSTYTPESCDKQYDAVIRNLKADSKPATIASFYFMAKAAGICIVSDVVANISKRAATHKKAHSTEIQSVQNIIQFPEVDASPELIADVVKQVYDQDIHIDDVSDIETCRIWIRNSGLTRNEITGQLHPRGEKALTSTQIAEYELRMREDMPDVERSSIRMVLDSAVIPSFHEIKDFFKKYKDVKGTGSIARLAACIKSPTGAGTDYVERMLRKWLVGAIACVLSEGDESHTMLVLCGEKHGDGKSYFFKNLLPEELRHLTSCKDLSALSNATDKKDFEISITKSWLIFDDEMGNKSKRDHSLIKAMLAKSYTDVRAAYARTEEHRKRISFFGGTSNDLDIISDWGDNRRIVPIQISPDGIDQAAKDQIDQIEYIMEAYHLYQSGFDFRILRDDVAFLNEHTQQFKETSLEAELIAKNFRLPEPGCGEYLTGSDVKSIVESSIKDKIRLERIKPAMREIGIKQEFKKINGVVGRFYYVCRNGIDFYIPTYNRKTDAEPF